MNATAQPDVETRIAELIENIAWHEKTIRQSQAEIFQIRPKFTEQQLANINALKRKLRNERYLTRHGQTIHSLRSAGCTVRVTHIRYTTLETNRGNPIIVPVPSFLRHVHNFNARGGATHVVITKQSTGKNYSTTSICDKSDSFDYKMGVKLALDLLSDEDIAVLLAP